MTDTSTTSSPGPQDSAPDDQITLDWKAPPPITYGARRQAYPYDAAIEMLADRPEEWLSLRSGPSNRMDQFRTRFKNFALQALPEDWDVQAITRSLPEQTGDVRMVEVFARIIPIGGDYEEEDDNVYEEGDPLPDAS